jgi:hypothetical protein
MNCLDLKFIILASTGLFLLNACTDSNQSQNIVNKQVNTSPTAPVSSAISAPKKDNNHGASKGGQVVEIGEYHLEFVPEKEANQTHMDLYLQTGDSHEDIPNAQVTAQVQLPDGTQKTVPFTYDAKDKHYTGILKENKAGQYQVKISAAIKNKKVDGRFSFNR